MKNIRVYELYALITVIILASLSFLCSVSSASVTTNFADVPADWRVGETWNAPTYVDYNVLHNGNPSIRMEKGADPTKSREILVPNENHNWAIYAKPGDHIVFKVWMKTSLSSFGDTHTTSGIRLGITFTADGQFIADCSSPDGQTRSPNGTYPSNLALNYVNWGHDWQQRTMDFILQSTYYADGSYLPLGTPYTSSQWLLTPWIQVWCCDDGNADNGVAWFADAELYVNPPTTSRTTSLSFTCTPTHGVVPWTSRFQGTLTTISGAGVANVPIDMKYWDGNSWQRMGVTTNTDSSGAYSVDVVFRSENGWVTGISKNLRATFAGDISHDASVSDSVTVSIDGINS